MMPASVYVTRSTPPEVRARARALGNALKALGEDPIKGFDDNCSWALETNGSLIEESTRLKVGTVTTCPPRVCWATSEPNKLAATYKSLNASRLRTTMDATIVAAIEGTEQGDMSIGSMLYLRRPATASASVGSGGGPFATPQRRTPPPRPTAPPVAPDVSPPR